jgi:suppressor of G2 allele of SKP1
VKPPRNWDKLVAEEIARQGEDKPEGEAALNELFKKIYGEGGRCCTELTAGSDEVRRAMNKSFSESGGTVLSTNWSEIGAKPTELKAPDGMEWKKY